MKNLIFKSFIFFLVVSFWSCGDHLEDEISLNSDTDVSLNIDDEIGLRHDTWDNTSLFEGCEVPNLFVCADPCFLGTPWECAIRGAVDAYNNLPDNIPINMTLLFDCSLLPVGETANIIINCANLFNATGRTFARLDPNGTSIIELNNGTPTDWPCGREPIATCCQLTRTVMHELGHALGFGHSDPGGNGETFIEGTDEDDENSVLITGGRRDFCDDNCDFSAGDLVALDLIYGCNSFTPTLEGPEFLCNIGDKATYCLPCGSDIDWNLPNNMSEISRNGLCITVQLESFSMSSSIGYSVSNGSCDYSSSQIVETMEFPIFDIEWNNPVCLGDIVKFTINALPSGQVLSVTNWTFSNGLNELSSNRRFGLAEALTPGRAEVCATVRNRCGREKTYCRFVNINSASDCTGNGDIPNPK